MIMSVEDSQIGAHFSNILSAHDERAPTCLAGKISSKVKRVKGSLTLFAGLNSKGKGAIEVRKGISLEGVTES